jgi:hypothetical protein
MGRWKDTCKLSRLLFGSAQTSIQLSGTCMFRVPARIFGITSKCLRECPRIKLLFGREPILPVELRLPTLNTLIEPDLDMEETAKHRQSRIDQMEKAQSICKAHIPDAQVLKKKNYARWNRKRKRKTDSLVKGNWILMKKPGTIVGPRLRWKDPYLFRGWKDPQSKRKAVIQDASGQKWHRVSFQLRKYYPRLDFARVYLQAIKEVSDRVSSAAEIPAQFAQAPFNTLSFVTLKIAERIAKMRKSVGFLPLENTPRFLQARSVSLQMSGLDDRPDDVLDRIFNLADRQNNGNTDVIFRLCCVCRTFRRLLSDTWHWAYFRLEILALSFRFLSLLKEGRAREVRITSFSSFFPRWTPNQPTSLTCRMKFF